MSLIIGATLYDRFGMQYDGVKLKSNYIHLVSTCVLEARNDYLVGAKTMHD